MASRRKTGNKTTLWNGLNPGATVVVDTAPFIYLLEENDKFSERFLGLFEHAARGELFIALSTITLAEVLTGPLQAKKLALAKRYEKALSQYHVIPVSAPIAVLAAQLRTQYRLKLTDAIQLATALDIGAAALVTHDRDFSRITGIPILLGEQSKISMASPQQLRKSAAILAQKSKRG